MADEQPNPSVVPESAPVSVPAPADSPPAPAPDASPAAPVPEPTTPESAPDPSAAGSPSTNSEPTAPTPGDPGTPDAQAAAEPASPPAAPVVVDNRTRRSDNDALLGSFVDVVSGEHHGRFGAYVADVEHDRATGYPALVLIRTRDADNLLLEVLYQDIRPSARTGGR